MSRFQFLSSVLLSWNASRRFLLSSRFAALLFSVAVVAPQSAGAQESKTLLVREAFRDTDGNRIPDRSGETVTLTGVLTSEPVVSSRRGSWANLQDDSGGVVLFTRDSSMLAEKVQRGDSVKVTGEVGFHNGMSRLLVKEVHRLGTGLLPAPSDILVSDLLGRRYTGRLVRVAGELIVPPDFLAKRGSVSLRDRTGTIPVFTSDRFFTKPAFLKRFQQGGGVELVGIASQFKEQPPYDSGYQIIPRDPDDFRFAAIPPYRAIALAGAFLGILALAGYLFLRYRYSERWLREMTERAHLDGLRAEIGVALGENQDLPAILQHCSEILVRNLDVAFFRIWTLNNAEQMLELQASAGLYTHLNGPHRRVPVGCFKIGLIAQERQPHLTNEVLTDPRVSDREWAKREGMVAFAGYPLLVTERVVGVMATFARRPFGEKVLSELQSVAGAIAQCIERKRAEEALRRAEEFTRSIVESSLDMIITTDLDRRITGINQAAEKAFGYGRQELLGQPVQLLYANEQQSESVSRALRESGQYVGEILNRRRNGEWFSSFLTASVLRDKQGRDVGQTGISRDISEQKRVEACNAAFSVLGQRLSAATDARAAARIIVEVADPLFGWDACSIDLYSLQDDTIQALLVLDTIEGKRTEVPPAYSGTQPTELTRSIIEHGAQLILRKSPLTFSKGLAAFGDVARPSASLMFVPIRQGATVTGVISFQSYAPDAYLPRDLSTLQALADYCGGALERLEAETRLQNSKALYQSLVQTLPQNVFRKDRDGRFVFANERFCQSLGKPLEEVLGKTDLDLYPAELATKYQQDDRRVLKEGKVLETIEEHHTPDGQKLYVQVTKAPVLDENGDVQGVQGIFWDITQAQNAQAEIREQARLLDLAQDAIVVCGLSDGIQYWNQGAQRLYGWTVTEIKGRNVKELLHRDASRFDAGKEALLENGEWNGELRQVGKGGQDLVVNARWTLLRDEAGHAKSVLAIHTDITEKKKLEAQFLRTQRLESIGTLASGIAHDLNNILAPISMAVQLLRLKPSPQEYERLIAILDDNGQRAAGIIKQLLTFARGAEGERIAIRPRDAVKEVVRIAKETFPKNIAIRYHAGLDLWPITGDPTQLNQVLLNLCVNARDAMPDGGTLTVTVENLAIDKTYASMTPGAKAGPYVVFQVADTGSGIPQKIRDRIFDPFFTTKPIGKGTGLGLSTVLGILKGHRGFIQVESEPGQGTVFKVFFPAQVEPGTKTENDPKLKLPRGQGELILMVDDEVNIREMTQSLLASYGYEVLAAEDGAEGTALFAQHAEQIKLVITDMNMPIMDGVSLVRTIRKVRPDVRIIASSGLGTGSGYESRAPALKAMGVETFLNKPYRADRLLTAMHEALHQG